MIMKKKAERRARRREERARDQEAGVRGPRLPVQSSNARYGLESRGVSATSQQSPQDEEVTCSFSFSYCLLCLLFLFAFGFASLFLSLFLFFSSFYFVGTIVGRLLRVFDSNRIKLYSMPLSFPFEFIFSFQISFFFFVTFFNSACSIIGLC